MELEEAIKIIKEFEGCVLHAYLDPAGIWTIGYGDTHHVTPGLIITQAEAENRLIRALQWTSERVLAQIPPPILLNDNQYQALCSFTYNEGPRHLHESTIRTKIMACDWKGAADAFLMWDLIGAKVSAGLFRRRQAERSLFLKDTQANI